MRKNDVAVLTVTGMTAEGSGVGRVDGMAVFVPGAAPGDVLNVKIIKVAKNYAVGRLESVITPSPDRVEEDCPRSGPCGGCVYRHIRYEAELRVKEERVRDAMERIGGLYNLTINPIIGSQRVERYRNKAQLPIGIGKDGSLQMGFYARHSHRIIPCDQCLLQPYVFTQAIQAVWEWAERYSTEPYNEQTGKGRLRHLYLRLAEATGEVMVCLVVNADSVPGETNLAALLRERVPGLKSFVINTNREKTNVILGPKCRTVWGQGYITDTLCGLSFRISPLSFYQVNHDQAELLYTLAGRYAGLTGSETVLDLYCGTGTIGLSMAKRAKRLVGVELVAQAVENARENAALNGIENAEFRCADAAEAAKQLKAEGIRPDVVVLDPPRKGCGATLIDTVASMEPERVVYVSCDPATLARDLALFCGKGYQPRELTPVDMFPRTAHVETVCLLSRKAQ